MSKFKQIIEAIYSLINDQSFKERSRVHIKDFTRNRSLPFNTTIVAILDLAKKSLQINLNHFTQHLKTKHVTKQAFSFARQKVKWCAFRELNDKAVYQYYSLPRVKTFRKKLVLAIDGSTLHLPHTEAIKTYFGTAKNQTVEVPRARISVLYDVMNKLVLDSRIVPYRSTEKDMALEHLKWLKEFQNKFSRKIILLLDRGYSCTGLFLLLKSLGIDFICPAHVQNNQRIINQIHANLEGVAFVRADTSDIRKAAKTWFGISREGNLPICQCLVKVVKTKKNTLLTSLESMKTRKIIQLYRRRYGGVEPFYRSLKADTLIENFSGIKKQTILQEFFGTMLIQNLARILEQDLEKNKLCRWNQVNHREALAMIKEYLVALLRGDLIMACTQILQEKIGWIKLKPGRSYKRIFKKCLQVRSRRLCYA